MIVRKMRKETKKYKKKSLSGKNLDTKISTIFYRILIAVVCALCTVLRISKFFIVFQLCVTFLIFLGLFSEISHKCILHIHPESFKNFKNSLFCNHTMVFKVNCQKRIDLANRVVQVTPQKIT